jgi:uncharacterized membrane protein YkvA (DUF1232 family)
MDHLLQSLVYSWLGKLTEFHSFTANLGFQCKTLVIALRDPRLPVMVRLFLLCAIFYLACPLDIKPDFLPGGLSDDSIVTPLLTLAGLLSIPANILKEARCMADHATCSLVCVILSGTSLSVPTDPTTSFAESSVEVGEVLRAQALSDSWSLLRSNSALRAELEASFLSNAPFSEHEAPPHDYSKKGDNRLSIAHNAQPATWLNALAIATSFGPIQRRNVAIWECARGHQLQLYSSGDESDSSANSVSSDHLRGFFRPPFISKGGLFHHCCWLGHPRSPPTHTARQRCVPLL